MRLTLHVCDFMCSKPPFVAILLLDYCRILFRVSYYTYMDTFIALSIVIVLWTSALVGSAIGRRHRYRAVALQRLGGGLGAALATIAAATSDHVGDGLLDLDRFGTGIAVFVTTMSVVVTTFAGRSLAADARADRFFVAANALTGSTVLLAFAGRPWLMAAAWLAVSASTVALIGFDGRPGARTAARRAARAFAVGDIGVVLACVVATLATANTATTSSIASTVAALRTSGTWLPLVVGAAILVAALARSAQLPFCGWLATSVEAPTPVSAMLHAGVVNGSAILLIRWHPLLATSTAITIAAVLAAVAGIVLGMAVGRTRPDVKSGLAWTTVAQMGFMVLQCSLGLVGPAVVHLMAHGAFKSSLFLGAGSGLDDGGRHRHPRSARPTAAVLACAGATASGIVALGLALVRPHFLDHPAAVLPVAFAGVTVAYGFAQWWARTPQMSWQGRLLPIPAVAVGFTALTGLSSAVDGWVAPTAGADAPRGAVWLAVGAIMVVAGITTASGPIARRHGGFARQVWMLVAAASVPTANLRRRSSATALQGAQQSSADDARRARIRSTIVRATNDLAPSWPLERFVATNPLVASEHLPIERAVELAAAERGVRAELDELSYRARYEEGRISAAELRCAARDHLTDTGGEPDDDDIDRLVQQLLHAPAVDVPTIRPVLLSEWHDLGAGTSWADTVDELSSWWCAAHLSDHPASPMPGREGGLYASWTSLVRHDPRPARRIGASFAHLLAVLPERSDDAVMRLLIELGVDRPDHEEYLRRHLHRHPGWTAAMLRSSGADGDDLVDLLAIRLAYEAALLSGNDARRLARRTAAAHGTEPAERAGATRLAIWRDAFERHYRDDLLSSLATTESAPGRATPQPGFRAPAQVVCCIDARSEGLRRQLEATGPYETIGFAGFFGLAIAVTDLDAADAVASCPVIVEPQAAVVEVGTERHDRGMAGLHAIHEVFATTKRSAAAPFALAETFGWATGAVSAARTVAPATHASAARAVRRAIAPESPTTMTPDPIRWWTTDEQVAVATSILRTTGIWRNPARLVVLCGHRSSHVNNLHRSALDCGACGGRGGGNNARVAANLLNDPAVRAGLAAAGLALPDDTWFVAAEHDTTSDRVSVLDRGLVPASHRTDLAGVEADLDLAGFHLAAERGTALPSGVGTFVGPRPDRVRRRGHDWAQVVPEWGLAGNAAIVIGPRALTAPLDLERRAFLHSYDADDDTDGAILEAILGGPLVVAHWISSQYRLSTIDPAGLGAGTKTAHNLVGGVGVIEGAGGDIRLGLPAESVSLAGTGVHDPMRLLVVIDAETATVDRALRSVPAVAQLVDNGWIRLAGRAGGAGDSPAWALRRRGGGWHPWHPSEAEDRPTVVDRPELAHPMLTAST